MEIVLGVLYMLAGILLAIPYCLLAGWSAENFLIVTFVAPAFLFVWFMAASFAGIIEPGNHRMLRFNWRATFSESDRRSLPGSLSVFWAWTLYSFLPVILHWSAVLLEEIGYETVSSLIDTHRYASPLLVLWGTILLFILIAVATGVSNTVKEIWTRIVHR